MGALKEFYHEEIVRDQTDAATQMDLDRQFDEFIEKIPFNETRNYVKKVMASYWMYKNIYPSER